MFAFISMNLFEILSVFKNIVGQNVNMYKHQITPLAINAQLRLCPVHMKELRGQNSKVALLQNILGVICLIT